MTITMRFTLMAVVLLVSMHVQLRAQSSDGETPAEETVASCPCGDPTILVPLNKWPSKAVDCFANQSRATLYGFSFDGGVASLSATVYGRDCQFVVDAVDLNAEQRPISKPQVAACSGLILNYAQALKDAGRVAVSDVGCKLR